MKVKNSVVRASGIPGYCAVGASGVETAFYATKVAIFIKTTECFALKLRRFAKKLRAGAAICPDRIWNADYFIAARPPSAVSLYSDGMSWPVCFITETIRSKLTE